MSSPPPKGWSKLQTTLLLELKAFDRNSLKHVETRVKTLLGDQTIETRKESKSYNVSVKCKFLILVVFR